MTTVRLGVHSIKKTQSSQKVKIIKTVPHPAYNGAKKVNDLMLLKVRRRSLSSKTSPSAIRHKDPFFCLYFSLNQQQSKARPWAFSTWAAQEENQKLGAAVWLLDGGRQTRRNGPTSWCLSTWLWWTGRRAPNTTAPKIQSPRKWYVPGRTRRTPVRYGVCSRWATCHNCLSCARVNPCAFLLTAGRLRRADLVQRGTGRGHFLRS